MPTPTDLLCIPGLAPVAPFVDAQLGLTAPLRLRFPDETDTFLVSGRVAPLDLSPEKRLCLDGAWSCVKGLVLDRAASLADPRTDASAWPLVTQPGVVCIADPEAEPREIPNWDRRMMTHIPENDGAVLRRTVDVPAHWAGHRIFLRLDGVYPAADVYLDGVRVAVHRSGLTACCVDCTAHARPGEPLVVAIVLVRRYFGQEIDMPRHSSDYAGLRDSVWLHALPACHVEDHHLVAELDADLVSARLRGPVHIRNTAADFCEGEIELQLFDAAHRLLASRSERVAVPAGEVRTPSLDLPVTRPALWCDEHPRLHHVVLVWRVGGQTQALRWRVGFRRLASDHERPTLNGRPLKLRAVNHLSLHPEHGLHTPVSWLRRSLELMRRANINAIRTHFTAPSALADLCDELGFLLVQEITIDWYGHELWRPRCLGPCLHRIEATVRRDRHHACLVAFGIGNENLPANPAQIAPFRRHYEIFHALAKRLSPFHWIMYPPPGPANKIPGDLEPRIGDIADVHYNFASVRALRDTGRVTLPESWEGPFTSYSREELRQGPWTGLWFSSEYGIVNAVADMPDAPWQSVITETSEDWLGPASSQEALANRLEREWGLMRDDPTCLGGAYFPWLPPGRGNPWGWTLWAEDADWGVVMQDLTPKPQFWVLRAAYSPVTFAERRVRWRPGQTGIEVTVRNRYGTHDLRDCTIRTQLGVTGLFLGVYRDWKDIPVNCPPGADARLILPLWHDEAQRSLKENKPILYRIHVIAPDGFRPITHEILVVPEGLESYRPETGHLNLGSDA
jgi:beta-galactosidase